ncbi:MAG: agmatine deiminase [Arenicella sp.]|jgi:agmatine deiminase
MDRKGIIIFYSLYYYFTFAPLFPEIYVYLSSSKKTRMKRTLTSLTLLATLLFSANAIAQIDNDLNVNLPKGMTDHEKLIMEDYLQSFNDRGITTPPAFSNIRTAAEWEEVQALVITWTNQYNTIQSQIVDASQDECLVIIHCTDSNSVKSILSGNGVPDTNIDYIEVDYNSVWIRDYGANTMYNNYVEDLFLVDWMYNRPRPDDDIIPDAYAAHLGLDLYSMTSSPNNIMSTGGNWMSDGDKIAFSSELVLDENDGNGPYALSYPNHSENQLDQLFQDWMGINDYIKMTVLPYDDIHHIDMHMKIIDEQTLLIGEYPAGVSDGPQIEANLQYVLGNFTTKFGTPFDVHRIVQPPSTGGNYPGPGNAYYRTYANQTFVNNTILLPTYRTEFDTVALNKFAEIMPGYNIVSIDVDNGGENLIASGGAIHCITHTVGVNDPIYISHQKLEDTNDDTNPYPASAFVKHKDGITGSSIWYKTSIGGTYSEVTMTNTSGDDWDGLIPAQADGTTVYYYIEGTAVGGKQVTHPIPAPTGYHKFTVSTSGGGGGVGIDENPITIQDIYPNPASEITVIPVHSNHSVNCTINLTNMLGQVVEEIYSGSLSQGDRNFFIDASQHAAGMYQVLVQMDDYKTYKKLMIK